MNFINTFDELSKLYENADKNAEKKVVAKGLEVNDEIDSAKEVSEQFGEKTEEGLIGDTIRGAVKGFLGEETTEEGLIGDTIRGAARGFLGEETTDEGLIGDTIRGAVKGFLGEEKAEEGLIGDTIRGAVKGFLGEEKVDEDEIEIIDDEPVQVVLECKKCGALVVVDEADVKVDEETDLVNVDNECKFCEEKEGFVIVGSLAPYSVVEYTEEEPEEEIDEESEEEFEEKPEEESAE